MSNQISLNVILLVIIACGAYYISNKNHNQVIVIPSERGHGRGHGGDDRYTMAPRPLRTEPGLPSIPSR